MGCYWALLVPGLVGSQERLGTNPWQSGYTCDCCFWPSEPLYPCLFSLISTDATARGIDVQGVELVINYDAPQYLRTYVHR